MSAQAAGAAHPLLAAAPALATAAAGVAGSRAGAVCRALGGLAVRGVNAYVEGPVYKPLYSALQDGSAPDADLLGRAVGDLVALEADGMLMLARLERRVVEPEGGPEAPSPLGYRGHRVLTWRLRAMLTALREPYPEQLLDVVLCARNARVGDGEVLAVLQG